MARGLAAVYDPDLEAPGAGDRSIRMDPALRLEASPAVVLEDANLRWAARQLTSLLQCTRHWRAWRPRRL